MAAGAEPGAIATLVGDRVDLVASNDTDTTVRVASALLVDAGAAKKRAVALPEMKIRAGEHRVVPVSLGSLGLSLQHMRFSGMVLASAEIEPAATSRSSFEPRFGHGHHGAGRGPRRGHGGDGVDPGAFPGSLPPPPVNPVDVFAAELYFHRPGPGAPMLAYGAEVLRSSFGAGDLSARIRPPLEGIALQRIVAGGGGHFEPFRSREARIRSLGDEERVGGNPARAADDDRVGGAAGVRQVGDHPGRQGQAAPDRWRRR